MVLSSVGGNQNPIILYFNLCCPKHPSPLFYPIMQKSTPFKTRIFYNTIFIGMTDFIEDAIVEIYNIQFAEISKK